MFNIFKKKAPTVWIPTFEDDFDTLDLTKWHIGYKDRPNLFSDHQQYLDHKTVPKEYYGAEAITVSNSILKLHITYEPKTFKVRDWNGYVRNEVEVTITYAAGVLVSYFTQRFGFFEARCKMPSGGGHWPAFWLSGATEWPPEIDIFEVYTTKGLTSFESNYHWGAYGECFGHQSDVKTHKMKVDLSADFHIYGCEWDSCYIKWFFDGKLIRTARRKVNHVLERMHIIISMGIHETKDLTIKNPMEVDYIRVYKKQL